MPLVIFLFFSGIKNIPPESLYRIIFKAGILRYLGKISYSLYLSHLLIIYIFYDEIQKIGLLDSITKVILILCLQISFANFLYIFVERKFLIYRVRILELGNRTKYILALFIVIPISINYLIMLNLFYN
jgi:peptidoglycan/LPS O-acetylase OafA/YrhL